MSWKEAGDVVLKGGRRRCPEGRQETLSWKEAGDVVLEGGRIRCPGGRQETLSWREAGDVVLEGGRRRSSAVSYQLLKTLQTSLTDRRVQENGDRTQINEAVNFLRGKPHFNCDVGRSSHPSSQ